MLDEAIQDEAARPPMPYKVKRGQFFVQKHISCVYHDFIQKFAPSLLIFSSLKNFGANLCTKTRCYIVSLFYTKICPFVP